jgi:hypothetical protein
MTKLLCITTSTLLMLMVALTHGPQSRIQDIDFRNFSYPFEPPSDRAVFAQLGAVVRVRNGIAYADKACQNVSFLYFKVAEVIYGDVTGDGQDESAVVAIYGSNSGTFYLTDIYLFTLRESQPILLSTLREEKIGKD